MTDYKKTLYAAVLLAVLMLLYGCSEDNTKAEGDVVFYVNGDEVTQAELTYFENSLRAEVMSYFVSEYSAEYSEDFWTCEYNGKTPYAELRSRAIEKCTDAKLRLALCREYGIYTDISFAALRQKAEQFNLSAEDSTGPGITKINMNSFYTYYLETGELELVNRMARDKLSASDADIEEYISGLNQNDYPEIPADELTVYASRRIIAQKYEEYIEQLKKDAVITQETAAR